MSMGWQGEDGQRKSVVAPTSCIITAFSPVLDTRQTWTPELRTDQSEPTVLVFFDLAAGKQRLGGSSLAQVFKQIGAESPNVEDAQVLKSFFNACQQIRLDHPDLVLAYHDRSDGGLLTTIVEMCFAGRVGAEIMVDAFKKDDDAIAALFNEELGAVFQVRESDAAQLSKSFIHAGFPAADIHLIGRVSDRSSQAISIASGGSLLWSATRGDLQKAWSETSYKMQALRDSPKGALEEFENITDESNTGLFYRLTFDPAQNVADPFLERLTSLNDRPKVAILREQGVNGHIEMAYAFNVAGFAAVDVHMSDIISGKVSLSNFKGLAACGGFSYGDVLGAGNGWAKSILLHEGARREFTSFFGDRKDTFALAVCNGCQLFSQLKEVIPGAEDWPLFKQNLSGRFEGRVSLVEIDSPSNDSVFLRGMHGSILPVAVAHGEGRATFVNGELCLSLPALSPLTDSPSTSTGASPSSSSVCVRYVDPQGARTERYPYNPNGSPEGVTGVSALGGRVLALMPHPERVILSRSNSWTPPVDSKTWAGRGPWARIFENAREWVA